MIVFHTSMARRRSSTYTHTGPLSPRNTNVIRSERRGTPGLLGKGTRIIAKEFKKSVGVSVHVEFHLPLFQNLQRRKKGIVLVESESSLTRVVPRTWLR